MRAFWLDPYLWIHLAGLAALPLFLELCLVGLAIGDPILPVWLEVLLVALGGIAPVLWMQWQRPFYIFSIVVVALKPEQLTDDQRRLLTLFKSQRNRWVAVGMAIGMLFVLRWLYTVAAIASTAVPNLPGGRATGLLLATVAFLGSNLFLQVPVSVAGVMLTQDSDFANLIPYAPDQIRQSFTVLGLQIRQILPPVVAESPVLATIANADQPDPAVSSSAPVADSQALATIAATASSVLDDSAPEPALELEPEIAAEVEAIVTDLETELAQLETETTPPEPVLPAAIPEVEVAELNSGDSGDSGNSMDSADSADSGDSENPTEPPQG